MRKLKKLKTMRYESNKSHSIQALKSNTADTNLLGREKWGSCFSLLWYFGPRTSIDTSQSVPILMNPSLLIVAALLFGENEFAMYNDSSLRLPQEVE